jgi:divalent metal cation (Fe/Co/Zn/Cd) transporter
VNVDRALLVRRGLLLSYATALYNSLEGLVAIGAGLAAGSVALVGFGVDSAIELSASGAALWRLRSDRDAERRARSERHTLRVVGALFLALALYVAADAVRTLLLQEAPRQSAVGIALAVLSLVAMPLLARAKRRVAVALGSAALVAESRQTLLCTYLSGILLGGLLLNAAAGWWWADPVAALAMVPLIGHEGIEALRGRDACGDGCSHSAD